MIARAIELLNEIRSEAKFCCAFSMDKEDVQEMLDELLVLLQKIEAEKKK